MKISLLIYRQFATGNLLGESENVKVPAEKLKIRSHYKMR